MISFAGILLNIEAVISGVFSVFPAILSSTMLVSVREHGSDFAGGMAKSMMLGLSSVATYATAIHFFCPIYGIIIGTIVAYFITLCATATLFKVRSKIS